MELPGTKKLLPRHGLDIIKLPRWRRRLVSAGQKFASKRLDSSWKRFLFLVMLPTVAVFFYTAVWASPMYISTSKFAIRGQDQSFGGSDMISMFLRSSSSSLGDSYLVVNYVHSLDLFSKIDGEMKLRKHFSDKRRDFFSRLAADESQQGVMDYWKWATTITFDPDTGIITCSVKAYTPEMARDINARIITLSEDLINDMNERSHADTLALAVIEVKTAEDRLIKAQTEMREMRERTTMLDPRAAAETLHAIIGKLEGEAAQAEAELNEARSYMKEASPQVETIQRKLAAIRTQLEIERNRLSSLPDTSRDKEKLTAVVGDFENLLLEEEFARKQLTTAMASLEGARIRSEARNRYLVPFEPPLAPDESLYPRVIRSTIMTFIGASLLLALLALLVASIREHAGF